MIERGKAPKLSVFPGNSSEIVSQVVVFVSGSQVAWGNTTIHQAYHKDQYLHSHNERKKKRKDERFDKALIQAKTAASKTPPSKFKQTTSK